MPGDFGRPANKRIVAGTPDLFFGSKLSGVARQRGIAVQFATTRTALLEAAKSCPHLVVADLDAPALDAIGVAREICEGSAARPPRMIAYGSHVRADRLAAARLAGFDEVLTKGALAARVSEILDSL